MTENGGATRIASTRLALKASTTNFPSPIPRNLISLSGSNPKCWNSRRPLIWFVPPTLATPTTRPFNSLTLLIDGWTTRLKNGALMLFEKAGARAPRRRADGRAEHLDIIDVAAEERGDVDRRTRLYQLGREAVSCVEASVFGDKGGEERQRVVGVGNADLFFSGENARGDEHRCEHYGNRPDEHE